MSIEWLAAIDEPLVSEVQLADGWHTIVVSSFTVSPQDASFSFDETVSQTHTSPRTRVVVGPLERGACGRVCELTNEGEGCGAWRRATVSTGTPGSRGHLTTTATVPLPRDATF